MPLPAGNGTGASNPFLGGAIYSEGFLTLTRCTVSGNTASSGAIYSVSGTLTLLECTFSGNNAQFGGGVYSAAVAPTITQCTFSANSAQRGEAISGNSAPAAGAIQVLTSATTLEQSTVSKNSATAQGGGVRVSGGSFTLTNSIVAGNLSNNGATANISGTITSTGANLTSGNSQLAALGNYGGPMRTMSPLAASPAIDAATGSGITTDQRGLAVFNTPDLGATEGVSVVSTLADELDSASTAGTGVSLREAIRDTPAGSTVAFGSALSGQEIAFTRGSEILLAKT